MSKSIRKRNLETTLRKVEERRVVDAIELLKTNGYRVSKPKPKPDPYTFAASNKRQGLNAIGRPYSPQFDPNYRRRTPLTSIARLLKPMPSNTQWVR